MSIHGWCGLSTAVVMSEPMKTVNCPIMCAGLDPGRGPGGQGPPPPPNPVENGAKFLCLKGKGRTISSGHKEPQNCNFQPPHAC